MKNELNQIVIGVVLAVAAFFIGYMLFINTCDKYDSDGTWTQGCKCLGKKVDKNMWLGKFTYGKSVEREVMCVGIKKTSPNP